MTHTSRPLSTPSFMKPWLLHSEPPPNHPSHTHLTAQCRASWLSRRGRQGFWVISPGGISVLGPPGEEGGRARPGGAGPQLSPPPPGFSSGGPSWGGDTNRQVAAAWGRGQIKARTRPCPFVMQSRLGNDPAWPATNSSPTPSFPNRPRALPDPPPPHKSSSPPGQEVCECPPGTRDGAEIGPAPEANGFMEGRGPGPEQDGREVSKSFLVQTPWTPPPALMGDWRAGRPSLGSAPSTPTLQQAGPHT